MKKENTGVKDNKSSGAPDNFIDDVGIETDQKSVRFVVDESGSVTNDSKSLLGQLRVLRNALYENYSP